MEPMIVQKHSLYEDHRMVPILIEHDCIFCEHQKVCHGRHDKLCINFRSGDSRVNGCLACLCHFARLDPIEKVPCFWCREFRAVNP